MASTTSSSYCQNHISETLKSTPMKDKKRGNYKPDKLDRIPRKENTRARYEKLQNEEAGDSFQEFEDPMEIKIKKAMAEGEFDNLQGRGKPLDLSGYNEIPDHLRTAYHVIKNAGYVPEEVRLKKEMELIKEKIRTCNSEKEKEKLKKELADISQQFHFYMDYNRQFKR